MGDCNSCCSIKSEALECPNPFLPGAGALRPEHNARRGIGRALGPFQTTEKSHVLNRRQLTDGSHDFYFQGLRGIRAAHVQNTHLRVTEKGGDQHYHSPRGNVRFS